MPVHYIKLGGTVRQYAVQAGAPEADWRQAIFDDVTSKGKAIVIENRSATQNGVEIGLCGDKFYCTAGMDQYSDDTLFIFGVYSASRRVPTSAPRKYSAQFLIAERGVPQGNSVQGLFREQSAATQSATNPRFTIPQLQKVFEPLSRLLRECASSTRREWGPGQVRSADTAMVAGLWNRHNLTQHADGLSERTRGYLRGTIRTQDSDRRIFSELIALLQVDLLNRFVEARRQTDTPGHVAMRLLDEACLLPLEEPVRAALWGEMLSGVPPETLRRELHQLANTLDEQSNHPDWSKATLTALRDVSRRHGDNSLLELAMRAEAAVNPLSEVANWARALHYATPEASQTASDLESHGSTEDEGKAMNAVVSSPAGRNDPPMDVFASVEIEDRRAGHATPGGSLPREVNQAGPGADLPSGAAEHGFDPVDSFLLRVNALDETDLMHANSESASALRHAASLLEQIRSIDAAEAALTTLERLKGQIELVSSTILPVSQLSKVLSDLKLLTLRFERAGSNMAELLEAAVDVAHLEEIAFCLEQPGMMASIPSWIWNGGDVVREPATAQFPFAARLLDQSTLAIVKSILRTMQQRGATDTTIISELAPPPNGANTLDYVERVLPNLIEQRHTLRSVSLIHRGWLEKAQREGASTTDIITCHDIISSMLPDIGKAAGGDLLDETTSIDGHDARLEFVTRYAAGVQRLRLAVPQQVLVTLGHAALREIIPPGQVLPEVHAEQIQLLDERVDNPPHKATLRFVPHNDDPYGYVTIPLLLQASSPQRVDAKITVMVTSGHQKDWPARWDRALPETVDVTVPMWRPDEDRKAHRSTMPLRLPIRPPVGLGELRLTVSVVDRTSNRQLFATDLSWGEHQIDISREPVVTIWPDNIQTEWVDDHPIGPQRSAKKLLLRAKAGSSFSIIAPRRFGKSTLATYLQEQLRKDGFVVPDTFVCEEGVSHELLWRRISDGLEAQLSATISSDKIDGALPVADGFDRVREAACSQGKKGIVLLFDEAQLFFPKLNGSRIGDRLKTMLEKHWSTADKKRVPVVFGLIGLPSFTMRAGANLQAKLESVSNSEIDEGDLNKLLLKLTLKRLQTTKEARQRLAEATRNAYVLRLLLDRLVDKLNSQERLWASADDVVEIERSFSKELRSAPIQATLINYLRDPLSDAENVNDWVPSVIYPTALALARVLEETSVRTADEIQRRTIGRLNDWCTSLERNQTETLTYTPDRVNEHLATLQDRNVLDGFEFRLRFMQDFLIGQSRTGFPVGPEAGRALRSGAVRCIRIPDGMELYREGGQAKVYRWLDQGSAWAVRCVELESREEEDRFHQSLSALHRLTELAGRPGSECIFQLRDVGLSTGVNARPVAVQIYRWIDGVDLSERKGQLNAESVVVLGQSLVRALSCLHEAGVLHRDVAPRNIILAEQDQRPVLIDFGLARLSISVGQTRVSDDGCGAPEVMQTVPQWSTASDVYSLAATLRMLLSTRGHAADLSRRLSPFLADDPKKRLPLESLGRALDDAYASFAVAAKIDHAQAAINRLGEAVDNSKVQHVVSKFSAVFRDMILSGQDDGFRRAAHFSDFLNQVAEAVSPPSSHNGLGNLAEDLKEERDGPLRLANALRNERSHGNGDIWQRLRTKYRIADEGQLWSQLQIALERIERNFGLSSLEPFLLVARTGRAER